jgi:hypothetical protein
VTIHAQLLNAWDAPIRQADVPVTVAQSVFGGQRVASINGKPVGDTDTAYTNANGVATYRVVGKVVSFWELTLNATILSGGYIGGHYTDSSDPIQLRFREH